MALVLWLIFRSLKWVFIPLFTCSATATLLLGVLGATDWRMTVISSNSVAVLLIVTLSLSIHLVVRYRELLLQQPQSPRSHLSAGSARLMLVPCLYTAMTTIVAFASLVVAGLQPVIDFGWMMTTGIVLGFCSAFTVVPALMTIIPDRSPLPDKQSDKPFTLQFAHLVQRFGKSVIAVTAGLIVLSVAGIRGLEVENRFIDYFKEHTEIYQGMELLDARMGGTIPLDVILLAPAEADESTAEPVADEEDDWADDDGFFDDAFGIDFGFGAEETTQTGYWFSVPGRQILDEVHRIIEDRSESGKMLSLSTAFEVMDGLYGGKLGGVELALVENSLPDDVNSALVAPFYFAEEQEARLSVRVMETSESLRRDAYLRELREDILLQTGIAPERLHFTSLLVLYNNVLQSLFQSQIMTLGAVFLAIGLMFWVLFRSLSIALLALAPNVLAAGLVLGLMGLAGIPLDIMTITIAAIVVGIGVDDCIHYLHRFRDEIAVDQNYRCDAAKPWEYRAGDVLHHANGRCGFCHADVIEFHSESVFRGAHGGRNDRCCCGRAAFAAQADLDVQAFWAQRNLMQCRPHCGACCVAPAITRPFWGMPDGKAAGERCVHLTVQRTCRLFGDPRRPRTCIDFHPSRPHVATPARRRLNYSICWSATPLRL